MYKSLALIEGRDVSFQPELEKEVIGVKGFTKEDWKVFTSNKDLYWDMKHPFMLGEEFSSLEEYNTKLEDMCKEKSHNLCDYVFSI